ncbi:Uncharacterised protein [uncultured archaeon]|nr:Uncharacterised protein [uncultured archaeon]
MRLKTLSALVGAVVYFSTGCASVDSPPDQYNSSKEIRTVRHWNPLYRIGDPDYWFFGEVEEMK